MKEIAYCTESEVDKEIVFSLYIKYNSHIFKTLIYTDLRGHI